MTPTAHSTTSDSSVTTRTFSLTLELPLTCPQCHQTTGYLYEKEGVCLGCMLENEEIDRHEAQEQDAFWGAAETACTVCGID